MRTVLLFIVLCVFWVLLSGEIHSTFLMGAGVVCCGLTAWFCTRLDIVGDEGQPTRGFFPFLRYLPWLSVQVLRANLDVIRRVWHPERSIRPRIFRLPMQVRHPVAKALYANSITLTPGTVTVRVDDDSLLVHALTEEAQRSLEDGAMEQRIVLMEEESS